MRHPLRARALLPALCLLLAAACGGADDRGDTGDTGDTGAAASRPVIRATAVTGATDTAAAPPIVFTAADLEAYERGIVRETALVREAQERARTAATPAARGAAAQAQWKEQTMPEGARSAGLPEARYAQLREAVDGVLQTLDFQGKIDGPMSLDTARATPEMRRRLASDPFDGLAPASAGALRARLDRLAPLWIEYVRLTAVAG